MKFAYATKHLHFALTYREPIEDDAEFVDNTGGDFTPADSAEVADEQVHFGFAPAVKRG